MPTQLSRDSVVAAPKVLLHDHLDGGVRAQTVIDLAQSANYEALPTTDADKLDQWFRDSADSGSLERYLETFQHTVAVMQTVEGLQRVAREAAEDLADVGKARPTPQPGASAFGSVPW
jgi:adenosine deaminase